VFNQFKRIARRYMKIERPGNTPQTTVMVNDGVPSLGGRQERRQHRAQFFAISALMMRGILVDAARARGSRKRGGGAVKVNVEQTAVLSPEPGASATALHEALPEFSNIAPRHVGCRTAGTR
jgi:hypothetical protein